MASRSRRAAKLTRIGVISDTHGLVRPEALRALEGSDLILHAGDVGKAEVLEQLAAVAPVRAVRGNVDKAWAHALPESDAVEIGETTFWLIHDRAQLDLDPAAAGFAAVVCGHSHRPRIEWKDDVLYLNPGSAGPRRFKLPVALALIELRGGSLGAQLVELAL
jgi:putative phosphoesterase